MARIDDDLDSSEHKPGRLPDPNPQNATSGLRKVVSEMVSRFAGSVAPFVCPACEDGAGTVDLGNGNYSICQVCGGTGLQDPAPRRSKARWRSATRRLHLR